MSSLALSMVVSGLVPMISTVVADLVTDLVATFTLARLRAGRSAREA